MSHARTQHPNAVLTPEGRRRVIDCVLGQGWTVVATAQRFQVAKTVRKWRDRFVAEGPAGLWDRSSRPHSSPTKTSPRGRSEVIRLRKRRRWGADHIAFEVGLAASTVQNILRAEGLGRLDVGDRATDREPVRRYQRDRPGELIHVDVKKLSGIPDGGNWRIHGRGQAPSRKRSSVGYRFIHSAVDDRTRLAYSASPARAVLPSIRHRNIHPTEPEDQIMDAMETVKSLYESFAEGDVPGAVSAMSGSR